MRAARPVSWIKAARRDFEQFPIEVQSDVQDALTFAADGEMSGKAKAMKGLDSGIFEIASHHRGNAYRAVYALKVGVDIWGGPRVPEEIRVRRQNPEGRDRRRS